MTPSRTRSRLSAGMFDSDLLDYNPIGSTSAFSLDPNGIDRDTIVHILLLELYYGFPPCWHAEDSYAADSSGLKNILLFHYVFGDNLIIRSGDSDYRT